jgi:hypothetical protein
VATPNPSLQRTRLRSPLNSISLDAPMMSARVSRASFALVPVLAWAAFLVLRPPNPFFLSQQQEARATGGFFIMSGMPYTHLAERPLYTWSNWHGGEHIAVKALELATLPGLIAGCVLCFPISLLLSPHISVQSESWVRFGFVVLFSTLQWAALGPVFQRAWQRRVRKGV